MSAIFFKNHMSVSLALTLKKVLLDYIFNEAKTIHSFSSQKMMPFIYNINIFDFYKNVYYCETI